MEKIEVNTTEKIKFDLKAFFAPRNFKEIMSLTGHIFFQLFIIALISQINVLLFSWYETGDQLFASRIAKATILINAVSFIPSLIASGTLVVGSNLFGQNRQKELSSVVTTGIIVNFLITLSVFIILQIFAKDFLGMLNATDEIITTKPDYPNWTEINFCTAYFRINIFSLLIMSVTQVYISGLQVCKKQGIIAIGAICSNFVDVIVVCVVLYVFKLNPVYAGLAVPAASFTQLIYMMIMNFKYIDYKNQSFKELVKFKFVIETVKIGLPITLEMGLWNICNFVMLSAITNVQVPVWYDPSLAGTDNQKHVLDSLVNLNTRISSIMLYSTTFLQAIGTVTSILVAQKAGLNDKEGAFKIGIDCWRISIYAQLILSSITFILIYPIFLAFHISRVVIIRYGILLFGILFIKYLFDTVNMTLLRSLWSVGDLWIPLLISVCTMVLFMGVLPKVISNNVVTDPGYTMAIIFVIVAFDPIVRSIIYIIIWFRKKWFKYVRQVS